MRPALIAADPPRQDRGRSVRLRRSPLDAIQ